MTSVIAIDPLSDPRWRVLVDSHPLATVFHTPEWLEALKRTYGYKPFVLTTCSEDSTLTNGIPFCEVNSWLTGSKWISLPFSDHCDPLVGTPVELQTLVEAARQRTTGKLKFAEVRPLSDCYADLGWRPEARYCLHTIDLRPDLPELYSRLHKDSIRRKVRRAEREQVVVESGRSDLLLGEFYELMLCTRRRHRVPPQPITWFRNLISCFGPRLTIYVARAGTRPIASILTLRHRHALVYKYGCSDERYHNLGGTPRLFWEAIQNGKSEHLTELDLGRSDEDNAGLIRFKDHLGASKRTIRYWRCADKPAAPSRGLSGALKSPVVQFVLSHLPDPLFRLAGAMLYRHAS
jgi:CelD/BcsL family acetyltransferase involved in cellulose biosynthesis